MMYGYAEDNSSNFMPVPLMLAHEISRKMEGLRKNKYTHLFGSDGKLTSIDTIVVSTQTKGFHYNQSGKSYSIM